MTHMNDSLSSSRPAGSPTTMSTSSSFEQELICSFCNKQRIQIGNLPCGHQMCASCYPYYTSQLKKCYLCVVECHNVEKRNMRIVSAYKSNRNREEKQFCPNKNCDFIGAYCEMNEHEENCPHQTSEDSNCSERSESRYQSSGRSVSLAGSARSWLGATRDTLQINKFSQPIYWAESNLLFHRYQNALFSKIANLPFWSGIITVTFAMLFLNWKGERGKPQYLTVIKSGFEDPNLEYYITHKFSNISNLVVRAGFKSGDMQLSKFVDMQNYQIKLGIGTTFNTAANIVQMWPTAVVMKSDDDLWSVSEYMQLRLEHSDPNLVQSYDFQPEQRGNRNEYSTVYRKKILYRQIETETFRRMKLMRFSNHLTYDEAVSRKFINDDTLTIGFKLFRRR